MGKVSSFFQVARRNTRRHSLADCRILNAAETLKGAAPHSMLYAETVLSDFLTLARERAAGEVTIPAPDLVARAPFVRDQFHKDG